MENAKTITTFLIDGTMRGPRYVQFDLTMLRLFVLPRLTETKVMTDNEELSTPCFYVLTGEENGKKAYIGQAASFKNRVIDHKQKKDFWDTAFVFVASDKVSLTTTDVQYLEYRAVIDAESAGNSVTFENKNKPKKPTINKHRIPTLERVYNEAKQLIEFVGCDIFVKHENTNNEIFSIEAKGVKANGYYDGNAHQFIVQKGSQIVQECVASLKNKELRKKQISETTELKDGKLVLKKDLPFNSPSGASCFVLGSPSNGWDVWKDKDGKSLNDLKK